MFKLFVVTFACGQALDSKVLDYDTKGTADRAYEILHSASGKSFNVVITKLY